MPDQLVESICAVSILAAATARGHIDDSEVCAAFQHFTVPDDYDDSAF